MKRKMKAGSVFAVLLSVTVFFAGCGGGTSSKSTADNTSSKTTSTASAASSKTTTSSKAETKSKGSGLSFSSRPDSKTASSSVSSVTAAPVDPETAAKAAAEAEGYISIAGKTYTTGMNHSEDAPYYIHADKASFDKGYLNLVLYDFDKDGTEEMLLLTVEHDLKTVKVQATGNDIESYDFRLHMFEQDASGAFKEASELDLPITTLPVDTKCDFFYKDYSDYTGIFYNMDSYEWSDDSGYGALIEYYYKDGTLQVKDNTFSSFSEDRGFTFDESALRDLFGDMGVQTFNSFGFTLTDRNSLTDGILDQDSSCICIARITSSQNIDNKTAVNTEDLSGMLNFTISDSV